MKEKSYTVAKKLPNGALLVVVVVVSSFMKSNVYGCVNKSSYLSGSND